MIAPISVGYLNSKSANETKILIVCLITEKVVIIQPYFITINF